MFAMRVIFVLVPNGGYPMINYEFRNDEGIHLLYPQGSPDAVDFTSITNQMNTNQHGNAVCNRLTCV